MAVLANDSSFHERVPEPLPSRPELRDVFESNLELRRQTAQYNGSLQAACVIVAIRALGLAAGPMSGFDADRVDATFFSDSGRKSHLVANIGYPVPDPWLERLPRLAYEYAVRFA